MLFLVDESLGKKFSDVLKNSGEDVLFVGDVIPKVDDEIVLSFANKENRIIITADKDFGELVFRLNKSTKGIIIFRVHTTDPEKLFELAESVLGKAKGNFIVVEVGQIRVRKLK